MARRKYINICEVCGQEFHPYYRKQKYCSNTCKSKLMTGNPNLSCVGKTPWNKGIPRSSQTKEKVRKALLGRKPSPLAAIRSSEVNKGNKYGCVNKGKPKPPGFGNRLRGKPAWNRGVPRSQEAIDAQQQKLLGRKRPKWAIKNAVKAKRELGIYKRMALKQTGEGNPNWRGGKSFEPYTPEFNPVLKRKIRKRDNYICQICGKKHSNAVHHINFDKVDCRESNLVTLCHSCHSKVNYQRAFWTGALFMVLFLRTNTQNG